MTKLDVFVSVCILVDLQVCPGVFKNSDAAYILSYSVIMLNTDQHNKQVVTRLTMCPPAACLQHPHYLACAWLILLIQRFLTQGQEENDP
jgi:Sec7 domain